MLFGDREQIPAHDEVLIDPPSRQETGQALPEGDAAATLHKPHAPLMQSHRVLVVLLHELLDREQMWLILIAEVLCEPDLLVEGKNFLRSLCVDVEQRPYAPQKLPRLRQRQQIRP